MGNIKVLVVEDKVIISEALVSLLTAHSFEVRTVSTGEEAIVMVENNKLDLILMDIQLAGSIDGITAASIIRKHHDIPIVYLSDYSDAKTVDRAKTTTPAAYLTKPFQDADLVRALDIAFYNSNANKKKTDDHRDLMVRVKQSYIKLRPSDIFHLQAERAYCRIITADDEYLVSHSMNHIYEQLDPGTFIRVHRSYVVNREKIAELNGNELKVGKHKIQVSKEHKDAVSDLFRFLK